MLKPGTTMTATVLTLLFGSVGVASAQEYAGPVGAPVDRNVADTGPNAASQRFVQPGLGQFGVGSLLTDRFGTGDFQSPRFDPFAVDPRVAHNQRYMLQTPGFAALIADPEYIGPNHNGDWVQNQQTIDGTEVLTLQSANTVFVLDHRLLQPAPRSQVNAEDDHPYRVQPVLIRPTAVGGHHASMHNTRLNNEAYAGQSHALPPRPDTYVHPEILERRRLLREEREREAAEREAAEAQAELDAQSEDNEGAQGD